MDKNKIKIISAGFKLQSITTNQSGVTTSPLDEVTFILIQYKYFEYLN
jgi:hypothetical protein